MHKPHISVLNNCFDSLKNNRDFDLDIVEYVENITEVYYLTDDDLSENPNNLNEYIKFNRLNYGKNYLGMEQDKYL